MPLIIHTSRYQYGGTDRLDITGRSKDPIGAIFEPTWPMVFGIKDGTLSHSAYRRQYWDLLKYAEEDHPDAWKDVLSREHVVFVCFCQPFGFCHRYLLVKWFVTRYKAIYEGEIATRPPFAVIEPSPALF